MFAWPFHRGFTPTFKLISHPPQRKQTSLFCFDMDFNSRTTLPLSKQAVSTRQSSKFDFFSLNGFLRIQMSKTSIYLLAATDTVESPIQRDDITDVCQHAEFSEASVQMFRYFGNSSNCLWNKNPFCILATPPPAPTCIPQLPSFPPASPISLPY